MYQAHSRPLTSRSHLTGCRYFYVQAIGLAGLLITLTSCGLLPRGDAEAQSGGFSRRGPAAVDVAIARRGSLQRGLTYTGTTRPVQEVSLRSQVEGQLLSLNVDVGDPVRQGQVLARLDDAILVTTVNEAQAELAARASEVASAQAQVNNARTQAERARLELQQAQANTTRLRRLLNAQVEQARLEFQQAQADATRQQTLVKAGAIAAQQAQQAQTAARTANQAFLRERANTVQQVGQAQTAIRTANQALRSAQEQVRTQQQAVAVTQGRVSAQQAVVAQTQKRQSYSVLTSPITGLVLQRLTETGNLIQPGGEILKLGDFSQVKVIVEISELELAEIRLGQFANVRLDAFPNRQFLGKVTRLSPAADPTARLVPVEVTIPNSQGRIGSGLLARVSFAQAAAQRVVVPEAAFQELPGQARGRSTLFVVTGEGNQAKVAARQVAVGERADGQVEVLSGLRPGERFVARSGRPLKDGQAVRLSILSEKS